MAGFSESVKIIIDIVAGNAKSEMAALKTHVAEAEGGFNKFKAGASGALQLVSSTGLLAVGSVGAIGGAIAAVAGKGVGDFQKIALASGKFADATGLSVEQASKWLEVADHIGVSESAVSSAFRRMDVAIGNNAAGFKDLGIEVARNKDGSANLSETFLRTATAIQAIEDPTKRAAAAQKLFGKGFAEVAELIGRDAGDLRNQLQGVSDVKIITEDELAKARAFRGAMDDLGDAVQEAGMQLGQALVPGLTKAAETATVFLKGLDLIVHGEHTGTDAAKDMNKAIGEGDENIRRAAQLHEEYVKQLESGRNDSEMFIGSADGLSASLGGLGDASSQAADALKRQDDALRTVIDSQLAMFDSTFAVGDAQRAFNKAVEDSNAAAKDGKTSADDLQGSYDNQAQAALKAADATVQYASDQAKLEGKTLSAHDSQQILIGTLYKLASTASGPVAAQLGAMITQLQKVDAQKPNPTVTVTTTEAMEKAGDVQRKMDELDKLRPKPLLSVEAQMAQATVDSILGQIRDYGKAHETSHLDADTSAAIAKLDALNRKFSNMGLTGTLVVHGGRGFAEGGLVPGAKGQPVAATVHGGEFVIPEKIASAIRQNTPMRTVAAGGANGGTTVNVTINGALDPLAVARQIKQIVATGERAGIR